MKDYAIAVAGEEGLPACLALLGPVIHPDTFVLTARTADGSLAGAAGLLWQSWGRPPGLPAWIHVLPDCRGRGIGTALLQSLVRQAEGEAPSIWAARPLAADSPAAAFASAVGFAPVSRQLVFEADALRFLGVLERLVASLARRGRIPAEARLVPIDGDLIDPVTALVRSQLSTSPPDIARMMAASLDGDAGTAPVDPVRSRVLLVGGEVAGALLSRRQPGGRDSTILSNVVAPRFRRGWANALLLEGTTRNGIDDGARSFRFDCEESNRDTIGLAERCGAQLLQTDALFRYAVASAA